MKRCPKCNMELEDNVKFCTACGENTDVLENMVNNITDTPDTTSEFDPSDIINNKVISVFSYLGILVLVPILAGKDSKFARFHANQGLMLIISAFILAAVTGIISKIPLIGFVGGILSLVVSVSILILEILGIVNVVNGKAKELPIIGKYRLLK